MQSFDYTKTHDGNARLLATTYENVLRYDPNRGRWLTWEKHWWTEDTEKKYTLAVKIAERRYKDALEIEDIDKRDLEAKWALRSLNTAEINSVILAASRMESVIDRDPWDVNDYLLGVNNGVIDLRTGTLREGKSEDRVTQHIDLNFNPNAKAVRWEKFLKEIFVEDTLINFVTKAIGYSITGDVKEECLFLCIGEGANGKTKLLEVLKYILGPYSATMPFSAIEAYSKGNHSCDIAALEGKHLVTASETEVEVRLNEGRVKSLVGGDTISARRMYGDPHSFMPKLKIWLASNHLPKIADTSESFWRRIRVIPFTQSFLGEKADLNLKEQLQSEAEGILAWAVKACLLYQSEGLGNSPAVIKASKEYRDGNDCIKEFATECCTIGEGLEIRGCDLYSAYLDWTDKIRAPKGEILTAQTFGRRATGLWTKKAAAFGAVYCGINIRK